MADRFKSFEGDERNEKQSIDQFFNGKFSVFIIWVEGLAAVTSTGESGRRQFLHLRVMKA